VCDSQSGGCGSKVRESISDIHVDIYFFQVELSLISMEHGEGEKKEKGGKSSTRCRAQERENAVN
jgi:hypothetical protein